MLVYSFLFSFLSQLLIAFLLRLRWQHVRGEMRQPDERERFHQLQVSFTISTYFQVPFLFCIFLNFSHLIVCQCRCFLICAYKVLDVTPSKLTRKILLCNIYSTIRSCTPSAFHNLAIHVYLIAVHTCPSFDRQILFF